MAVGQVLRKRPEHEYAVNVAVFVHLVESAVQFFLCALCIQYRYVDLAVAGLELLEKTSLICEVVASLSYSQYSESGDDALACEPFDNGLKA